MAQFKALFTSILLFLVLFASLTTIHPAAAAGVAAVARGDHAEKSHGQMQQRKQRVNHGSFRGPRKHLLNPAVEHPLQLPKLPV
ncbi:hypothetical protein DITRI_Ditri07aG0174900 [Diplodiscus trichospermus]